MISMGILSYIFSYTGILSYIFSYTMFNTIISCSSTCFPRAYCRTYSPIQCSIQSSAVLVHAFHGHIFVHILLHNIQYNHQLFKYMLSTGIVHWIRILNTEHFRLNLCLPRSKQATQRTKGSLAVSRRERRIFNNS